MCFRSHHAGGLAAGEEDPGHVHHRCQVCVRCLWFSLIGSAERPIRVLSQSALQNKVKHVVSAAADVLHFETKKKVGVPPKVQTGEKDQVILTCG